MMRALEYNSGLSLEEAEERYKEVKGEFEKVKSNYSGLIKRFKRNINETDNQILTGCIDVLLPLGAEDSVQAQVREAKNLNDTLHYKIGVLNWDINCFLSRFKNTPKDFL
jgi:predicted transcriptional regulator